MNMVSLKGNYEYYDNGIEIEGRLVWNPEEE